MRKYPITLPLLLSISLLAAGCTEVIHVTTNKPMQMKANERTLGARVSDREIEAIARVNIKKADPELEHAHVNIDSFNGVVLLTGQVASDELRYIVADTVYKLNPVRELHNELVIGQATDFAARSVDTWISTKLKTQFLADADTKSSRINFVTEMKVVYLMGLVTRAEADRLVTMVRNTAGVEKVVKVFEYVD
ncbi:MAG TPA: BON domain-containing protein [Cellvibrio sp.]|nr:BON domain-containing protein [Cellvibrio sp.]